MWSIHIYVYICGLYTCLNIWSIHMPKYFFLPLLSFFCRMQISGLCLM